MPAAILCRGLRKTYGARRAVDSLDMEIPAGQIVGFVGPNGAGKTTAIRVLTTVVPADGGTFEVAGVPHHRPAEIRRRVGVLPESAGYPDGFTGLEVLAFHGQLHGQTRADARAVARRLLDDVGLADRGGSLVAGYSRGMRQRLGIARALINRPDVVFLDEPTLGLDPAGQQQVLRLIAAIAGERGATVILSTHLLGEVEQVCDRILVLNRGRIVADGDVSTVARMAAAPRLGRLHVGPGWGRTAERVLRELADVAAVDRLDDNEQLSFQLREGLGTDEGSARVLATLLGAEIPVRAFEFERGRLSEAFLTLTANP